MLKKMIFIPGLVLVAALIYGGSYLSNVLSAGSGFSAKNICSAYFLSSMPGQKTVAEVLLPSSPLLANVSYEIDKVNRQVDTWFFGLAHRRAVFSEGTGCTLLRQGREQMQRKLEIATVSEPNTALAWPQGSAAAVGNILLEPLLEQAFAEADPNIARNTKAIVVIHKGQLIAEKYAQGVTAGTPLPGWSMTKGVTNLLIGLLINDGKISLSQTAPVPLWYEEIGDPRGEISIDQLLRMSSGLAFDEEYAFYGDVSRMLSVEADAAGFAASKPLIAEPGSVWSYSSGTSNILSGIIRRTIGGYMQEYYDFTQQRLFLPLGIRTASLETDNNGTFIGSSYMYASARDWARLGLFCLQDGRWLGERLLPEGWMAYSTTPTPSNPRNNYGAHFWLNTDPEDDKQQRTWPDLPADAYSMNGFQGQRVIIIPSKQLVVVRLGFSGGSDRGIEPLVAGLIDVLAPD
ncbi:MAG: serine hydrolase [Xanthomonadales bacterium]|nr:serine hydrolase [Xanthomonadales bacterium]